jgi:translocation and assembly module TamB
MSWKKIIGWTAAGIVALFIVVAAGGYLYLRSSSFEHFALAEIAKKANQATGGNTQIGGLDFSLKTLTAHLYNITVRGTEPADRAPLLHADELTVGVKIDSVLHFKVSLRELLVEHPVVSIQVSREGKNNLPTPPPSQSSSHTSIFDLAVGHAQITNGEVNYNDRKTPMQADLYDLGTDIHYHSLDKRYTGELSYRNGHLQYAEYAPLAHNLDLKFSATPDRFEVKPATLRIGSSEVGLQAQLSNYSNPIADGEYQIRIHTQDFAAMSPSMRPAGDVSVTGRLHYAAKNGEPLLKQISVEGRLASEALSAIASGRRIDVNNLDGTYRLADGNFKLSDLRLETLGGQLQASAEMKHIDTTPVSMVRASLSGISLKEIQRSMGGQQIPQANISGTIGGSAEAAWTGSMQNLRAQGDILVRAAASSRSNPAAKDVPVDGEIHAVYDGRRQTIQLRNTVLRMPSAKVTAQGTVSDNSSLQVQVVASDLHQLASLASSFSSAQTSTPTVSGSATVNAVVQGSMKNPNLSAQMSAQNLGVEGSEWKSANAALHANRSNITLDSVSLVNATQGQANLSGSVGLKNWSYEDSNPIRAQVQLRDLRLADLQRMAKQSYPVSGNLSANISLQGSQLEPVGSGSAQVTKAQAYGEPIQTLAAKFHTDNGTIVSTLQVSSAAGAINGDLSFTPKTKAYVVRIDAPSIVLQKLQTLREKNLQVNGTVTASVNGQGTLANPGLQVTVQMPQLQVRQNAISNFKAEARVAEHVANLNLNTEVSQASIRAHGTVNLTGDYQTDAVIDTGTIPLEPLMATYAPSVPQGFHGQTELHASLKGPLKDKSRIEAHLSIPVLKADYQQLQIGISRPIQADYANSVVTLQPAEIVGTETSLRAQGRIPIGGTSAPTLTAEGSINMKIVHIVAPTVQSSGIVALDVRSAGKAISGQVRLQDVALATEAAPVGVDKLNGTIDIGNDRIQVTKMTAEVGGGQVSLGGSVAYAPTVQFSLAMQGKSVRLRYPEGLRSLLDTNLTFSGTTQASMLGGRVLIDNLGFTPDFDLTKFSDQFSTGGTVSQPGFADTVRLGISVQSQNLNAVSSQVSIAGQVALQVGGTAANPVITGRTTLNSGELFFRNVRYQLQRGVITFDDPNQTHPVLNVSVSTVIQQYNLTLTLRGPLDKLTTSYVSDPPLATADIINLVARGKTTEEQNASSQSTDSMLASQVAGQLAGSVQKLAGLSSLQIDPTLGGNQNPSARIAIQQRVSKNLLFSFSTDVSQPGSEIVQGEYQINRRWSISVERDQLGGVSIDGRYHKRF